VRYDVIRDEQSLRDWVGRMEEIYDDRIPGVDPDHMLFAVDCEWHGRTHVDGQLRTIQFAWTESDAVVIEFRNEQNEWGFELDEETLRAEMGNFPIRAGRDIGKSTAPDHNHAQLHKARYAAVGRILAGIMSKKDVRYIGHHFSADAPWMEHWLGLDTYRRCVLDTEFAQQTVDEASELGLERGIAMKYTTLGLYNLDLILWKKDNPGKTDGGYGFVPSSILIPYSVLDVIAPFRAYPLIRRQLEAQQLTTYYDTILNPFVTDTFTEMCMVGLPMDVPLMDELRELFHFARRELEVRFKERVHKEAKTKLAQTVLQELPPEAFRLIAPLIRTGDDQQILAAIKLHAPMEDIPKWIKRVGHLTDSPTFNIRSPDAMRRWLFDVEGLEPIKTTNQKAKGLPSMAWEKVLELPADRQRLYTPAVDKQTLQILSEQFDTLNELLDLNAVGNVCKAFLKEADVYIDDETGLEVKSENGLHQWLASDSRVHGMTSLTETGKIFCALTNKELSVEILA
jgi:DNA polymerase I-like protein with 3'-5' exonuclease and polymerase domains